jgi:hypothetical protein
MQAWFNASEMIMSPGSQSVGKSASDAVQHETKV